MKSRPISSGHLHAHRAGDASYRHFIEGRSLGVLGWALALTLGFAIVELLAGLWSNSLALLSDAGHMATDAITLALALIAQIFAKRPPSATKSFGFGRAEALAAFVNAFAMLAMVCWIVFEAAQRFASPQAVQGEVVFVVALIGLMVNLIAAGILSRDKQSINTRAALVNVMGDLLGSIAALAAGAVIYLTGWLPIDPLLSVFVSLLILKTIISILRESYHILMEGVPPNIDYMQVGADLAMIDGVLSVHDLHVWDMSAGQPALIGHIEIRDLQQWPAVLDAIKSLLRDKYDIDHVTLQAELPPMVKE
ncbi:cation transporter [Noviherbaspirillum cavernae]|uniref:Cation transporter n=1 Tax=Noviherbaspirillum cavernae TaxID=2320862 RepID=A0A418X681_9BURK|nr:cation diffusion facilitator family transporter [Noviherbaspirillum cavernae]RJG07978.1 cation transporter [Noviherbaspirillum cavernae]